jgi:hypothetical protein
MSSCFNGSFFCTGYKTRTYNDGFGIHNDNHFTKPVFVDETRFELVHTMLQTAALPLELFIHLSCTEDSNFYPPICSRMHWTISASATFCLYPHIDRYLIPSLSILIYTNFSAESKGIEPLYRINDNLSLANLYITSLSTLHFCVSSSPDSYRENLPSPKATILQTVTTLQLCRTHIFCG